MRVVLQAGGETANVEVSGGTKLDQILRERGLQGKVAKVGGQVRSGDFFLMEGDVIEVLDAEAGQATMAIPPVQQSNVAAMSSGAAGTIPVLLSSNHGDSLRRTINVPRESKLTDLLDQYCPGAESCDVTVNWGDVDVKNYVLQANDRVSVTPRNVKGA